MHRRQRFVAGLLALSAMTFSFAETVWASTCGPMIGSSTVADVMAEEMPAGLDCMSLMPAAPDEHGNGDGEPRCPFGPAAAAQGCAAAASLPAHAADAPTPSDVSAGPILSSDLQHDLLIETALFHPPRA